MKALPGVTERFLPIQCYASPQRNYAPKLISQHRFIVQHYFSLRYTVPDDPFNLDGCWELMRDMNFAAAKRVYNIYTGNKVYASAHFLIGREGDILQMVPLDFQAYHAGPSSYRAHRSLNRWSIGIENIGHDAAEFTDDQYRANATLSAVLMDRYGLEFGDHVGHSDIAVPHGRKKDPGPYFRWDLLRDYIEAA